MIFVTVSYGVVTRQTQVSSGDLPMVTVSNDPWIDVTSLNPHPVVGDHYDELTGKFTLDHTDLSAAQGVKLAALREATARYITGGFVQGQENLGDFPDGRSYWYATEIKDQINIHAAVNALTYNILVAPNAVAGMWCAVGETKDALTDWDIRDHNLDQVNRVCSMLQSNIANGQYVLRDASRAVLAAATIADVEAVVFNPY